MNIKTKAALLLASGCLLLMGASYSAESQATEPGSGSQAPGLHVLTGNHRTLVKAAKDMGELPGQTSLRNLSLHLKRPAGRQAALNTLIDQQHNPRSPNYRLWLTASQLDTVYGPDPIQRKALVAWLQGQGMKNVRVSSAGLDVHFDATASQVKRTFSTELHRFALNGEQHVVNTADPSVPVEFSGLVGSVTGLNDFRPKPQSHRVADMAKAGAPGGVQPQLTLPITNGPRYYAVGPQDFATIYNVRPIWAAGFRGAGQTVTVAGDSNLQLADWLSFRSSFGLSGYAGTLSIAHPGCADPGLADNEYEAAVDAEWASAAAPDANVQLISCPDSETTSGVFTAIENALNSGSPPAILSVSFGSCESSDEPGSNEYVNDLFQQAAAEGTSVFVSSGDGSSAWCDWSYLNADLKVHGGLSINVLAASPYAVAVGGTTYSVTLQGKANQYWTQARSTAANGYLSALSYIPEMAWNDSCGNPVEATSWGYSDTLSFCNSSFFNAYPGAYGTTGGNSKNVTVTPSWQSGVPGAPPAGARGVPDVALMSGGYAGSNYVIACMSDESKNGVPCDFSEDGNVLGSAGYGTSFSAPAFAGVQALINQKLGTRQGNPNYALYQIGRLEYTSAAAGFGTSATCSSALGNTIASNCVFIDTTVGTNSNPCAPSTLDCFSIAGQDTGLTSQSTSTYQPAFAAGPGWDYTTGLGTVNVTNLVNAIATVDTYVSSGYVDGDANGDQSSDVFFQGDGYNELGRWLLHRGEISHVIEEPSVANDNVAAIGDLDGDGKADVVWQRTDGTVTVWLSRGENAYQKTSLGLAPTGSNVVAALDVDGDGFADLILVNPSSQLATVWHMHGASRVQTTTETLPASSVVHGSGDFDQDGLQDLVVTSGTNVSLLLSLPGGNYTTHLVGALPAGSQLVGSQDMNGDGNKDLVFFNPTTQLVTVWLMTLQTHSSTLTTTLGDTETLVGLGDFDGDGRGDLLVENDVLHLSVWSCIPGDTFAEYGIGNLDSFVPTRWKVVAAQTH